MKRTMRNRQETGIQILLTVISPFGEGPELSNIAQTLHAAVPTFSSCNRCLWAMVSKK